jgi:ferrous iron transport protein A
MSDMLGRRHHHGPPHAPFGDDVVAALRDGETAVITEVLGGHQLQARLGNMGLRPGKRIVKLGAMPAGGPVTIECDGFRVALGRGIARHVRIERLGQTATSDGS